MSTLVWFRQDLRLADNPALAAAAATGEPVIPVYIFAPGEDSPWSPGGASRWWLHGSLSRLHDSLRAIGSSLCIRTGESSLEALEELAGECGVRRVVWNRRYEPAAIARDRKIKTALRKAGLETQSFNGALLHEPWTIQTRTGGPFQVFTAFWRTCKAHEAPAEPKPAPVTLRAPAAWPTSYPLGRLELTPARSWPSGLEAAWTPGSDGRLCTSMSFCGKASTSTRAGAISRPSAEHPGCRLICILAKSGRERSGMPHAEPLSLAGERARGKTRSF